MMSAQLNRTPSLYSQDNDPLSHILKPPPEESDVDRKARVQREAEAKRISERIDEELKQEREKLKKRKGDVKLLLLGQSESGKSTLQKQFQLMYNPGSLESEGTSWRVVVYFNVLRSVKKILTTLEAWGDIVEDLDANGSIYNDDGDDRNESFEQSRPGGSRAHISMANQPSPTASLFSSGSRQSLSAPTVPALDPQVIAELEGSLKKFDRVETANLRLRLSPLVVAEAQLADRLSGGITVSGSGKGDVFVRSGWQTRTLELGLKGKRSKRQSEPERSSISGDGIDELVEDVRNMLNASQSDIKLLWEHPIVKALIANRKLKLDEWSEFFLNDIIRISERDYTPTTDDILHARIQTMGVAEHAFNVDIHGKTVAWHLFDVGGARGQRHSWVPYFDTANAIIFVAPISAFDQYLEEDPRTNRIDDSLQLFTQICSNTLLKKVHLVLFLNKTDLLKKKLERGLSVQKYITSFGERPNDYDVVMNYFRAHFLQVHRKNNESQRVLYTHLTSVVDTKTTQRIIGNVRDSIFRGYLQSAALV